MGGSQQGVFQFQEPCSSSCADGDDWRAFEEGAAQVVFYLQADQTGGISIDQVGFREDDNAALDAEQPANIEMFAGLRLDGFVRGDYQQHQVDSGGAGQHVGDEALVSGDIDKAEPYAGFFQECETKVDG